VLLLGADLGDAPDTYSTTFGAGGPHHGVAPATTLFLGSCVDTDPDGQTSPGADGDDIGLGNSTEGTCVGIDDEDGVVFDTMVNLCLQTDLTVTAATAGVLDVWLDLDGDGTFVGPDDRIFTAQALNPGANSLFFIVPCDATPGDSYARFRFSSTGSATFGGAAMDGEVEDYAVLIKGFDFGDSPDPAYPTLLASDGARHIVQLTGNPSLGPNVDIEPEGLQSANHLGDDADGVDDEDGVIFLRSELIPGTSTTIEISAGTFGGTVNAWIDWNVDGDWDDVGEQIATNLLLTSNATQVLTLPVPVPAFAGASCARFRISSTPDLLPTGMAMDGEVEDYSVTIGTEMPEIGISKRLLSVRRVETNQHEVVFEMTVDNSGNVPLSNVQIINDLATAFADAVNFEVDFVASDDFTPNPTFDGDIDPRLLDGTDTLMVGESGSLTVQLTINPGTEMGPYLCSAITTGDSPAGVEVDDESQDGDDSDPDGDGDPTNDNDPTEVIFGIPPTDIPVLGVPSLGLLILLLASLGLFTLRRRRQED
jgi:hypothetical protein